MTVSVNYAVATPCTVNFEEGLCYIGLQNAKFLLWLNDEVKDVKLELHSKKSKLKFARLA